MITTWSGKGAEALTRSVVYVASAAEQTARRAPVPGTPAATPSSAGVRADDTMFNESFATAVENEGLRRWLARPLRDIRLVRQRHAAIAELLEGAASMEGKEGESRHDGAVTVLKALDAYGRYFQHPGWKTARG